MPLPTRATEVAALRAAGTPPGPAAAAAVEPAADGQDAAETAAGQGLLVQHLRRPARPPGPPRPRARRTRPAAGRWARELTRSRANATASAVDLGAPDLCLGRLVRGRRRTARRRRRRPSSAPCRSELVGAQQVSLGGGAQVDPRQRGDDRAQPAALRDASAGRPADPLAAARPLRLGVVPDRLAEADRDDPLRRRPGRRPGWSSPSRPCPSRRPARTPRPPRRRSASAGDRPAVTGTLVQADHQGVRLGGGGAAVDRRQSRHRERVSSVWGRVCRPGGRPARSGRCRVRRRADDRSRRSRVPAAQATVGAMADRRRRRPRRC